MAEYLLRREFERAGVDAVVESAGISDEEHGNPIDPRAADRLDREGIDTSGHHARQFTREWFDRFDLVLALDHQHERALRRIAPTPNDADKVRVLRSFDPAAVRSGDTGIRDPWYGDAEGFETTFDQIEGALPGIVNYVREERGTTR